MNYMVFHTSRNDALAKAVSLVNEGRYQFVLVSQRRCVLGIDLYKDRFWGELAETGELGMYRAEHPDIFVRFDRRLEHPHHWKGNGYRFWSEYGAHLRIFNMYNYYPRWMDYRKGFRPTEQEKWIRHLVWSFKNDSRISWHDHQLALGIVVPALSDLLEITFGRDLEGMTLVCVPASTKIGYKARMERFSEMLCESTGMSNAYSAIRYLEDGEARHGTTGHIPNVVFDIGYFKGKNVLVFDDVVTSGETIRSMVETLVRMGSTVQHAVCIARTCTYREVWNPIEMFMETTI